MCLLEKLELNKIMLLKIWYSTRDLPFPPFDLWQCVEILLVGTGGYNWLLVGRG